MQFGGGPVYTESDIVRGRRVLKNGAVAGYVTTQDGSVKWRIVKGVSRAGMDAIRARRGKVPLSRADAKKAFDSHYRRNYMNNDERRAAHRATVNRKHPGLTPRQVAIRTNKSLRKSMTAAKTRDQGHALPKHRIITDQRFKKNPGAWDYPDVDDGIYPKVRSGSSEAQKAAARKNIVKARAALSKAKPVVAKARQVVRPQANPINVMSPAAEAMQRLFATPVQRGAPAAAKAAAPKKAFVRKPRSSKSAKKKPQPNLKKSAKGKKNQQQNQRQNTRNQQQQGGSPLSLNAAVNLLRDYYQ
jgi:hypothetical protein